MVVLLTVLFLCILHTDIQTLIAMIVNADNACDQCALDALRHLERQFYHETMRFMSNTNHGKN